jgi:PAS domain S-box-containing protein
VDLTTQTVQWDARCCQLLGVERSAPPDLHRCIDLIHPEDRPLVLAAFARAADPAGDGLYAVEQRTLLPDGSVRWVFARGQMLFAGSGGDRVPQRLTGVLSDIHARAEALHRLQRAQQRAAFAEAAVRGFIYEWNFQTGTVERTAGIYDVLGYRPEDLAENIVAWRDLIHPEDYERVGTSQLPKLQTQDTYTLEYRLRHRAGHYIHVWDRGVVERNPNGQPQRVVGMTIDISARKQVEEELADVEERLRLALTMSGLTVAQSDTDARYTWIYNPHPDFALDRVVGKLDDELEAHAEARRLTAIKREVIATGIPFRGEIVYPVSDGVRTYDVTLEPRRDANGAIIGLLTAALDVTELKRTQAALEELNRTLEQRVAVRTAELQHANEELARSNRELERSNRELDRFAYVASHDLKSPLRAIDNLASWIAQDAAHLMPLASQEHLDKLRGRARRLETMLDDLLHYSRAGRRRRDPEWVDTAAVAHAVAAAVRGEHAAPSTLQIDVAPDLPSLYCEREVFAVVLRNLIDNAVKHHHAPAAAVISVTAVRRPGEVEFCVADNGPGIDPEYHTRIFEVFQTLRPRDEVEGSGMGLAIVKKAVATNGGRLWLTSEPGKGSAFHFTWP